MVAPMPRAAPVTTATLPSSGRSQSFGAVASAEPTRMTCASTKADLADSTKRTVDSRPVRPVLASGETYTSWTVEPLSSSLPSERVKPSRARCATRSEGSVTSSGVVPMTRKRAQGAVERMAGWKNSNN